MTKFIFIASVALMLTISLVAPVLAGDDDDNGLKKLLSGLSGNMGSLAGLVPVLLVVAVVYALITNPSLGGAALVVGLIVLVLRVLSGSD